MFDYSKGWDWSVGNVKLHSRRKILWYARRLPFPAIRRYCKQRNIPLARALEVGCGGAQFGIKFLASLANRVQMYFIDAAFPLLPIARDNIRQVFVKNTQAMEQRISCQDMLNLGFKDGQFDLVMNEGSYEHLHEKEVRMTFLRESMRMLKKGGCFVLAVPNDTNPLAASWKKHGYLWLSQEKNPLYYELEFNATTLKRELEEAGFTDIYTDGYRLWDVLCVCPYTIPRRILVFILKLLVPELTRSIRIKFAFWLLVIGRKP
ncbi:MAG: class I SAM-dependent methyltransferase [Candidatus Omnitrophica bacterium]|nr:class I SAM-dependent methyltransferase [Candidatus Omnitrophota bacterium]